MASIIRVNKLGLLSFFFFSLRFLCFFRLCPILTSYLTMPQRKPKLHSTFMDYMRNIIFPLINNSPNFEDNSHSKGEYCPQPNCIEICFLGLQERIVQMPIQGYDDGKAYQFKKKCKDRQIPESKISPFKIFTEKNCICF